jgi:hypothetical protein
LGSFLFYPSLSAGAREIGNFPSTSKPNLLTEKPIWKALLLVYRHTDADYMDSNGVPSHLTTTMPETESIKALWSFRQYPSIAYDYSNNQAVVLYDIVYVDRPIDSLTSLGSNGYWVSPSDTQTELDQYAPPGTYDSIFVFWPQSDSNTGQQIPSFGWGWAILATEWSNGATYATVANAPDWMWELPTVGEVWLHEWLHGVCDFYTGRGYLMPQGNADGGSSHGYQWSSTTGWASYYRDLMTGNVLENDTYTGIYSDAWQSGSILGLSYNIFLDYFYSDTTANYRQKGVVSWQSSSQTIYLGNGVDKDNRVYTKVALKRSSIEVSGRVYVPESGVGSWDSVAILLGNGNTEYWATLAYGTDLVERNHISIMRNDQWGDLYPLTLEPGWYTVKVLVDNDNRVMWMKTWTDGESEPDWQVSRQLDNGWKAKNIGFRHYGKGASVDDLTIREYP